MNIEWLLELDRQVLAFFNGSDSLFLDAVAMTFTSGLTWIPLYLALFYIVIKNNENMAQIALIVMSCALCLLFADGLADYIAKPYVARWRPSNDPVIKYTVDVVGNYRETPYGFFSAHAANTFSIALFFAFLVRSRLLTTVLVAWSLINCWTRMYLGVHYPGDILVGLVWGAIVGSSVYFFYQKIRLRLKPKQDYISTRYTSTGYSLLDVDVVVTIVACVCCYILIRAAIVAVL